MPTTETAGLARFRRRADSIGDYLADMYERGFDALSNREREAIGAVVNLLRDVADGGR